MAHKTSKKRKSYLTPNEVASLLMVSPTTVRLWATQGKLKSSVTPGGHRRFMRSEVDRFSRKHGLTLQLPDHETTRILIVDDDEDIAKMLTRLFADSPTPLKTMATNSGFKAGRLVQTFQPHIVLLDLMMPGIDGFEVCQGIKEDSATKATRVIAMTGYYEDRNVTKIIEAGAETCLAKPFDVQTLMEAIGIPNS